MCLKCSFNELRRADPHMMKRWTLITSTYATQAHMHRGISSLSLDTFFCQKVFQCEACMLFISEPIQALWEMGDQQSIIHPHSKHEATQACMSTYLKSTVVPMLVMWNICDYTDHLTSNTQTYSKLCNRLRQVDYRKKIKMHIQHRRPVC